MQSNPGLCLKDAKWGIARLLSQLPRMICLGRPTAMLSEEESPLGCCLHPNLTVSKCPLLVVCSHYKPLPAFTALRPFCSDLQVFALCFCFKVV